MAIRPAHTALFPHIDLSGTRQTALARRMGVSKQAVGQLVSELEQMGALERVPDPSDGRARLVRFAAGEAGPHPSSRASRSSARSRPSWPPSWATPAGRPSTTRSRRCCPS